MDKRIADLYAELAFPSANRLQSALRKEGLNVPLSQIKNIVSSTGSRQVLQPPPSYKGNITAARIDDRWVADLLSFESRPATRPEHLYRHVLLVQDIFSRYLWAVPMSTKTQTRSAFESVLDKGRKPRELNTDKGSEFTGRDFQTMLARRVIQHTFKRGLNDLATVDRAMGTIKDMLAKRMSEMGGDWLTHLEPVVAAYNKLDHSALHGHAPGEVQDDDDLRFQLRMENANKRQENVRQAAERQEKLEEKGGFRTLKEPLAMKRRAGHAKLEQRRTHSGHRQRQPGAASTTPNQVFSGGSKPRDERRRVLSREFLRPLKEVVARAGDSISMSQAARAMTQRQGFKQMLGELRMDFKTFVRLWPDFVTTGSGPAMRLSLAEPLQPRKTGTLLDYQ